MKIKIKNIAQIGNKAIIEIEKDNLIHSHTFPILDLEINPERNQPLFLEKLKEIYTEEEEGKKIKASKIKNYINQEIELNEIETLTPKERFRLKQEQGKIYTNANPEKLANEVYIPPKREDNEGEDGIPTKDKSNAN